MSGLGFGLERIGLAALARPRLFFALIIAVTAVFCALIPSVKFNGNVTAVIPRTSENFLAYESQHKDFRNFSRDVAVIVRSPRLTTAEGLEDLRIFQLDLSIADGVAGAFSIFNMPDFNDESGEIERFFPTEIENDAQATELLDRLNAKFPQAANLLSREENAALVLVALDIETTQGNDKEVQRIYRSVQAEVAELKPDDFEVLFAGLTPIGITILDALITDQVRLTLLGLAAGAIVALLFFRCPGSAVLCALPPVLTAVWSIGFFALVGIPITYLTTILPTLALILAYADGIVLHHRWSRFNRERDKNYETYAENLKEAVVKVGPASALTSVTTAIALASFAFSSSEALTEFAWLGVILVGFAFITVIIALPVCGLWFAHMNWLKTTEPSAKAALVGEIAHRIYSARPRTVCAVGFVVVGALFFTHFDLKPDYRVTDYLPRDSDTLEAERIANDVFGGRSLVFVSIPVVAEGGIASPQNRARLAEVSDVLAAAYGERSVFSLHAFLKEFDPDAVEAFAPKLQEAPEEIRRGYISKDDQKMLVSMRISSSNSILENAEMLADLRKTLSSIENPEQVTITGFPVLLSIEFTRMIDELRISLLIAIAVGIAMIGIATRSVFYALVATIPNLFPILFVEAMIYLKGGVINVTEVIALTIAFGIAIDNAVHVLNVFRANLRKPGFDMEMSLRAAVGEVGPALGGSTLIISVATAVMMMSSLPILPIVGQLIIVILIVALATNLVFLPANIVTFGKLTGREQARWQKTDT